MSNVVKLIPRPRAQPRSRVCWACIVVALFTFGCWAALGCFMCWEFL